MKNSKKILSLLLALAMVFSMAACGGGEGTEESTTTASGDKTSYTVSVKSAGGMALSGIDVYVYADDSLTDMKDYGQTDENGAVSFSLAQSDSYAITLTGVPKGYDVAQCYALNTKTQITLTSSLITGESLSGANLGLGDVMYDFSVTTPAGETVTLSEELAKKDVVVLNFWYNGCSACEYEFPYMQEAYEMYSDSVSIIAMDPLYDSSSTASYQESRELTFTMASVSGSWTTGFNVNGAAIDAYPTTVIVDRYGVICMIEEGALVSLRYWTSIFDHFTGDDYEQELIATADDLLTQVVPIYDMPSSEEIEVVINSGDIQAAYRPEEGDGAEYSWPFVITEKNGEACIKASNQGIEDSYAIVYADVYLEAGQAVGFDYLISSEQGADVLFVIVDDNDIYQISGCDEVESWKTCYPWVAETDGTYEVALCYLKDEADNVGDDTVYIKNMRIVSVADIDTATYLPREAATTADGFTYSYADIVLNESDGYYHVGSANGPLLLANLMGYSEFNEEMTAWEIVYNGNADINGRVLYDEMVDYFSYASNAQIYGYCTVNQELAELLRVVDRAVGFDVEDENEWLKFCMYYQTYGTSTQLPDPIAGLAPFSAYKASLGSGNSLTYTTAVMPRGYVAEFVPTKSGVYRITSTSESTNGIDGWIFDQDRNELLYYEYDERSRMDSDEVSMVYYMEAGTPYYIDIAFWDIYETGTIYFTIEYVGSTYDLFRMCSPGPFTYDSNATGDAMYYVIAGGIKAVLGSDGYYYEDLGGGKTGSKIYADFTQATGIFSNSIEEIIKLNGFDFSKTEDDLYIIGILNTYDGDIEAADEYLRSYWGEDYDAYAELYQVEDVYNGIYHGKGEDLTAEISTYLSKESTGGETKGCVAVDKRLAELLQLLMDKYTFQGVDQSWLKLCYYYDYLGSEG